MTIIIMKFEWRVKGYRKIRERGVRGFLLFFFSCFFWLVVVFTFRVCGSFVCFWFLFNLIPPFYRFSYFVFVCASNSLKIQECKF